MSGRFRSPQSTVAAEPVRRPAKEGDRESRSSPASVVGLLLERLDDSFDRRAIVDSLAGSGAASVGGSAGSAGGHCWTWGEVIAAAVSLAARLEAAGLRRGDRLCHIGTHSAEWILVDLACLLSGVVHVALHADARPAEQLAQAGWLAAKGVAFSGGPAPAVRSLPAGTIVIDLRAGDLLARSPDREAVREAVWRRVDDCDPEACATIMLSSGTSGRPHGVLHCQRALLVNAIAAADVFLDEPDDVRLSWLPMSHALARTGDLYTALVRGGCLNVVTDRRRVLDACRVVPPTVVLGVPAFFERLERAAQSGGVADLAAALGGRVRVCVSGAAPLRQRTVDAFADRGVPLVQGYGLAEAGPVVTLANPRTARPGTVGPPLAGVEVRIDQRPESRGQLLVRTPSRALGVLLPPDAEALRVAGAAGERAAAGLLDWMPTGDLAEIDADGHVRITGRLVDTLVLAGGVKVPPAEVERAIAEDPLVAQVCVIGDGLSAPVALVVPEPREIRRGLRRMGVRVLSRRAALTHPRVLAWLARRIARRQQGLPRAWRVRRAVLVGRPFDATRGEATESFKLKRRVIADHFRWVIESAAAEQPPDWMATVPPGLRPRTAPVSGWLAASLWGRTGAPSGQGDGFADAASRAAEPLRDAVAGVLEQTERAILHLRDDDRLYDPVQHPIDARAVGRPPLQLLPEPQSPRGVFSRAAEESLGEAGFWGLAVPEAFGGSGCTMLELARAITRIAAEVPTAAGMLSVHSSIGAVSAIAAFGSPEQRHRHLPGLAQGRPLSIFAATEPDAGCDLGAIRTRLERRDGRLLLSGTKMFITGATHGRLAKVLAADASGTGDAGLPAVVLVRLPESDTGSFRLRGYGLHPLRHAHNAALEFDAFEVDEADVLRPPVGETDGMSIVWHGLNRGRVTLAAQAAGTIRLLLAAARDYSRERRTWGRPIGSRQLVQGRLARMAAGIIACDSLAAWAASAVDADAPGDVEAITAKIIAGECVRDAAIGALGVHGGRAFLVGHPWGDSVHDHLAVGVYEGESDLLGLALFKGLCRRHPVASLPRGTAAGRRAIEWVAWRVGRFAAGNRQDAAILDRRLRDHARRARRGLSAAAIRIDRAVRRHGRGLAERQLEIGDLSAEVRAWASILAVAHHADARGDDAPLLAADCWCRLAAARACGSKPAAADHQSLAELGRLVVERGARMLGG
jgi:long-subunit acyl-CoA synthetase (AMP-forming)/alkylation response protein AidB-like acyl-CoA dehydrogenase